jgi:hypothetical protein
MNPYQALYSNPSDLAVAWVSVMLWLGVGVVVFRLRDMARHGKPLGYCWPAARAFLGLCFVIAAAFAVGLVFLAWLGIVSGFWFVWELAFLMGVICVFWVMPFVAAALVCWAITERWRGQRNTHSIFVAVACPVAVAVNAALYLGLCLAIQARAM